MALLLGPIPSRHPRQITRKAEDAPRYLKLQTQTELTFGDKVLCLPRLALLLIRHLAILGYRKFFFQLTLVMAKCSRLLVNMKVILA